MRQMLAEVVPEAQVEATIMPLLQLTFGLLSFDHHLYDQFLFYFGWQKSNGDQILLAPRFTRLFSDNSRTIDIPSIVHLCISNGNWETWRQALVLRKYLSLFEASRVCEGTKPSVPLAAFKAEWADSGATESTCFKKFTLNSQQ